MNLKRQHRICTDTLPVDITIRGEGLPPMDALTVVLARAGNTKITQRLNIVRCSANQVVVHVPASCAKLGAGVYNVRVFDNCTAVCQVQLELATNCKITDVTIDKALLDDKA